MLPPSAWTSTRDRSPPRRSTPSPARWCTVTSGRTPPVSRSGPSGSRSRGPATRAAPTGFHMARELRALGLDCAVAAVSKMQRPAADARRKNDRRDAEFIARMLATHNIVEVPLPDAAVEAARDLDRALDDATAEYPPRQAAPQHVPRSGWATSGTSATPTGRGRDPGRAPTGGGYPGSGSRGPSATCSSTTSRPRGARSRTAGSSRRRCSPSPGPTGGARPSRRSPASRESTH